MQQPSLMYVDAFTDRPFTGNPAAVCVLTEAQPESWMASIARETNQPATVFLTPSETGYFIRWFTPSQELPLCGHGTLAAAHTLWTEGYVSSEQTITLHYQGGDLTARRNGDWIQMDFPAILNRPASAPTLLLDGLGVEPCYVGRSSHSYLVEVGSEAEVRTLSPDIALLAQLDLANVIVTSPAANERFDFISRYFAPAHGLAEDAVTGSAHCCLAPYWATRLGKSEMVGYQASARGGTVRVTLLDDRVLLGGQAVTVMRGEVPDTGTG